jgi:uncharacterized C2H2 Zn-finger protein
MNEIVSFADQHIRCPRCKAYPALQTATELRRGIQYLTLRCPCCLIVYDAQARFAPAQSLSDSPSPRPIAYPN